MAITAFKTFAAFEVLTASDLNASFSQIINNPIDLWSPMTKNAAAGGFKFTGLGVAGAAGEALTYGAQAFVIGTTSAGTLTINGSEISVPNGASFINGNVSVDAVGATTERLNVGPGTGNKRVRISGGNTNANDGSAVLLYNASSVIGAIGNVSGIRGGAYDGIMLVEGTSALHLSVAAATRVRVTTAGITGNADNTQTCGSAAIQWSDLRSVLATFSGAVTCGSTLTVNGSATLGDAAADTITFTGTPAGQIVSGIYTPSISGTSNVAANTIRDLNYIRIASRAVVYGAIDIDPTSATTLTTFSLSLPIASNLAATYNLAGSGSAIPTGAVSINVNVSGDATNDVAAFSFTTGSVTSNQTVCFMFGYEII